MSNLRTRPYTMDMTSSPETDAYLERARRRDDPDDFSVCAHNVALPARGLRPDEAACPECSHGRTKR